MEQKQIVIGDKSFNLAPLNFKTLIAIQPNLGMMQGMADAKGIPDVQTLVAVTETVFMCLKKANPEVTQEEISDLLTVDNCGDVISAIFQTSGVKLGEAKVGP
jgi:hypothetical protein